MSTSYDKPQTRYKGSELIPILLQWTDTRIHRCLASLSSAWPFEIIFEIALPRTRAERWRLHSTKQIKRLEQMHTCSSTSRTFSCMAVFPDPKTLPPAPHTHAITVYLSAWWSRAKLKYVPCRWRLSELEKCADVHCHLRVCKVANTLMLGLRRQ